MPATKPPRLHLIDGSGYVYRAFHALPALNTSRGLPTNATLGFAKMLAKLMREEAPERIAVVFDAPGAKFRDEMFEGYKASRAPMPNELRSQIPYIRRIVEAMRLPTLEEAGVEADDVIGTLAQQASAAGVSTVIVTGDKDMMQLVDERTTMYDPMRERRFGPDEVRERFGVDPVLVPDVLGLMGDAIDDIPGVTGVGEKTAMALVQKIGPVEALLERLAEVDGCGIRGAKKIRETLEREADTARLSKRLATIRRDVPIALDLDAVRWEGPDADALRPLLVELEFFSLLRDLGAVTDALTVERREVRTAAEAKKAVAALRSAATIGIAASLDSPRASAAAIQVVGLSAAQGPVTLLVEPEAEGVLAEVAPLLSDLAVRKVGADLKATRVALARRGIALAGPTFDVSLASYCLNPSQPDHGVPSLAEEVLGEPRVEKPTPIDAVCTEAHALHRLVPLLEERLRAHEMERLFRDLEMPLAEVLAEMELAGVQLDVPALQRISAEFGASLERLMAEIYELAGGEFNIGSPPQLREVLFDRLKISSRGVRRGKTGLSTDVDVLTRLAREHPLPAKILDWRTLSKLKSTYVDALPLLVDDRGRLHTSFNQTVAATGRLSSSDPNLQNIPIRTEEGRRIRAAFIAAPGWRLISADYSQIELRLLAHFAEDAALIDAFTRDEDVHARTAADVFGNLPVAEGRRLAKVINYGIVYGMGPARAARELGVPLAEAEQYIAGYFARYPGVRRFIDTTIAQARERGFVTTVLGRRRYLPELGSRDPAVRQFAERAATNTPIQGSAADLIKVAMLEVRKRLRSANLAAQMLLQVHDELVLEAPAAEAARAADIVRDAMEGVWPLRVPLRVDVREGAHWAEVH